MSKTTFETLLNIPIRNEKDFFQYVRALYEEWCTRSKAEYSTLRKLEQKLSGLSAELPPQFFTGDIHSPVVVISLNPHADIKGRKSEIRAADYCKNWQEYLDFWTDFPRRRYAGDARSKDGLLSKFDCRLHRFLRGDVSGVTGDDLAQWNMFHMELFPIASSSFTTKDVDADLYPFILRSLEAISLFPRDLVLVLNRQLPTLLKRMARNSEIELTEKPESPVQIQGRKSKGARLDYTVKLPNGSCISIVGAPTFAAQGFDGSSLADYSKKLFLPAEHTILQKALGISC